MSNNPESTLGQRKEAILEKSPILRAFLDPRTQSDPDMLKTIVEQNGKTTGKTRLYVPMILSDMFEPSVPFDDQAATLGMLVAIGYEIGDSIEAILVLNDIRRQLNLLQVLDTQPDKIGVVIDGLRSALETGIERKKHDVDPSRPYVLVL
jgi:hypothetical protein